MQMNTDNCRQGMVMVPYGQIPRESVLGEVHNLARTNNCMPVRVTAHIHSCFAYSLHTTHDN